MIKLTFEKMLRTESEHFIARIWRTPTDADDHVTDENVKSWALGGLLAMESHLGSLQDTLSGIAHGISSVSAVEIINKSTGDGLIVYKNWP